MIGKVPRTGLKSTAIEVAWKDFESSVVDHQAGETQRTDMRHCFYAGALSMFKLIEKLSSLPEGDAVEGMMAMETELHDYALKLVKGEV